MSAQRRRLSSFVLGLLMAVAITVPAAAASGEHFTGRLVSYHGEDRSGTRMVSAGYALQTDKRDFRLNFRDPGLASYVGRDVELSGTRHGRTLDVSSYRLSTTSSAASTAAAAVQKNVAVVMFNFQNDTAQPYTSAFVAGVYFNNPDSVANYFGESSYGQMAMTGQVFGWYTIAYDNSGCDFAGWGDAAQAKAQAAGADFSGFTHVAFVFPSAAGCGWSGLAYLTGTRTWINQSVRLRTSAHELSHNFGVHHAAGYGCTTNNVHVAVSANSADCTLSEYGDPFSILGGALTRQSHAWHKAQMGWLGNSGDRQDVTVGGNYTLAPQEFPASAPKLIRVARAGDTGRSFYLEFRQPYGSYFDNFGANDVAVTGVTIRLGPDYGTRTQSLLLDATPETATWNDAPLPVGRTMTDPLSRVSFTTVSVSSSGAVVNVAFGVDVTPPTQPNLTVDLGANSAVMNWTASTDNQGVIGYRVWRGSTFLGTTTGLTWTVSNLSTGVTYRLMVVAVDARENQSSPGILNVTPGIPLDTQPPSAPANLAARVTKGGVTQLTWTASQDNVAVTGYRVFRNGSLFGTTTGTSYSAKKARGTWTYYVVAYDQAGNVSGQSNAVTAVVK